MDGIDRKIIALLREDGRMSVTDLAQQVRVLYGGSVKSNNVADLVKCDNVDGALVGGASLDGEEFAKLCALAAGGPLP